MSTAQGGRGRGYSRLPINNLAGNNYSNNINKIIPNNNNTSKKVNTAIQIQSIV